jgi:hypothetical protein
MDTFAGINTGVEIPVIDRHDEAWHYSLSQVLLPREREYVQENGGDNEPRGLDLGRNEVWQRHEGRGECRPARVMHSDDIPEEFYLMMAQDMLLRHRGDTTTRLCVFCRVQSKDGGLEDGRVSGMKNGGAAEMEDGGAAQ